MSVGEVGVICEVCRGLISKPNLPYCVEITCPSGCTTVIMVCKTCAHKVYEVFGKEAK